MEKIMFPRRKKSAQAMVEFAIALPILLLLLYGILEAGRLLFLYSTVVTASRQAVRYGATTGEGNGGVPRYQDCSGIRSAAQAVGYLGTLDTISLAYDTGPGTTPTTYCPSGSNSDSNLTTAILEGNNTRLVVTVTEQFTPLVRLVPFFQRNITAASARTILYSVPIVVDSEIEEVIKTPTTLVITADTPDPSEIFQNVNVVVTVTGGSPTGIVQISGADTNCQITLSNGSGNCNVVFNTAGAKVISAIYNGDADHLGSSDTEDHTVTLYNTVTTIQSDLPDPSVTNQNFTVIVRVTGNGNTPSGTVTISGGGLGCTITLSNGVGNCVLNSTTAGAITLTAAYNGDSTHLPSNDTEPHTVVQATPTPTNTSTPTLIPTATLTRTPTPSPTIAATAVPSCSAVTHGSITRSGTIMSMTITNPYAFTIVMSDITVTWNDDKGHLQGNKKLRLQEARVGAVTIWTGNIGNQSTYTIPTSATFPPGTTTVSFVFDQTYDNPDGTERVYINLATPGCTNNPIDSN